jgi:type II secretory pathway component PulJ
VRNTQHSPRHLTWRQLVALSREPRGDEGFTLLELILVCLLLPVIIGAIVLSLVSLMSLQGSTASRISDAADAQVVSAYFEQDVQSAVNITTNASASQCGVGTALLSFEWSQNQTTGVYESVVSYVEPSQTSPIRLFRYSCTNGASATPTSTDLVSSDMPTTAPVPVIVPSSSGTSAATGWTTTVGITGVTLTITEPQSNYTFSLTSVPRDSVGAVDNATVATPNASCGFATAGTGTYASSLCFVDFSTYNAQANPPGCGGNAAATPINANITNTPYILSFCLSQSGSGPVAPWPIPTYFDPPTSEAFLGNNGFYTNIPGDPALYETTEGTNTTITITDIKLLNSNGNAATGWELATGDAESTDAGESITWTSDQDLNILPNTPSSQYGNACAAPTVTNAGAVDLIGVGTTTVECAATVNSDKTGTVMLVAAAPTTLTAKLVGVGLEAIFVGVLLS